MIHYNKFTLKNGLKVIVHEDFSTPMVAMNILYDVGAKDESSHQTGFAHLFEHNPTHSERQLVDHPGTTVVSLDNHYVSR
jgi:predicted Zn-dependent peptidase